MLFYCCNLWEYCSIKANIHKLQTLFLIISWDLADVSRTRVDQSYKSVLSTAAHIAPSTILRYWTTFLINLQRHPIIIVYITSQYLTNVTTHCNSKTHFLIARKTLYAVAQKCKSTTLPWFRPSLMKLLNCLKIPDWAHCLFSFLFKLLETSFFSTR